jgi:hypothetical protein
MRREISSFSTVAAAVVVAVGAMTATPSMAQQSTTQQRAGTQPQPQQPMKVDLDDVEDAPEKYLGKTVMVEGEVQKVLGPNLFTIDEPDWVDPARELPVVIPDGLTAIVRNDAPVRVIGTIEKVPVAQNERRGRFFGDPKVRTEIAEEPVLVAREVTTVAPAAVSLLVRTDQPVGTSGGGSAPITDAAAMTDATDDSLVGSRVDLQQAEVTSPSELGFWIETPDGERIFVMPATPAAVKEGQTVGIQGVVLELPEGLQVQVNAADEPVYIYAEQVVGP